MGRGGPGPGPSGPSEEERKAAVEAKISADKRKAEEEARRKKEEEDAAMSTEEREAKQRQAMAMELKLEGNALYKKKQFDAAIEKYEGAIKADGSNPTFITNIAAVLFAKRDYDGCIAKCNEALKTARDVGYRDFTFIAKAWLRIGNALLLKKDYEAAIEAYDKSLLEDRSDAAERQKYKAEKRLKKQREREYLNPELAIEAKVRGNDLYREGKFPAAVEAYTEAIKRDPTNHAFYSNRANCYSKLMTWSAALADCEKCIELNPSFTKIYIRKGKIQHFLKNYKGAIETFNKGLALDPNST